MNPEPAGPRRTQHILTHLRERGLVDDAQVSRVRAHWRSSGRPLVHSLVQLGLLSEDQVSRTLLELTGLPVFPLETVDPSLLERVPAPLLYRTGALPLGVEPSGRARVATCAPFDVIGLDEVRQYLRRPLELGLAPWSEIKAILRQRLHLQETLAQTVLGDLLASGARSDGRILPDDRSPSGAPLATEEHAAAAQAPAGQAPDYGEAFEGGEHVVRLADVILADALAQGASDVHLEPLAEEVRLRFRIHGVLRTIRHLPKAVGPALTARLKVMAQLDITLRRLPQDGRLWFRSDGDGRVIDVRVSTLPTVEGEKVVMRLLDPSNIDTPLSALLAPADLPRYLSVAQRTQGLVLVTGPTGSGKTTTLYATLRHLLTDEENFVTIEQPVEYHLDGIAQVNVRAEDGASFAGTLRSILRQDPDVILVGEIRDPETARTALQAASTGHLVFSTLHTNDAASACTRLVDLGGEPFVLADALNGVLAQRLVRRLCPACRQPKAADAHDVARGGPVLRGASLYEPGACPACSERGYAGRVGLYEIAPTSPAVRALIVEGRGDGPIREALRVQGVPSMFAAGVAQVLTGATSLAEVVRCVPQDEIEQALSCLSCGAVTPPGARFCVGCGVATRDHCQGCGATVDPRWRHCAACGAPRAGAETP
ncbi:MAG: ATPase, T2SS/T4P/T4SS family [Planctomycetota bacterium]